MDPRILTDFVEWILKSVTQRAGWNARPGATGPSVTITSEVIVALSNTIRIDGSLPPPLLTRAADQINSGLTYIKEGLPNRPGNDLANYCFATIAHIRASSTPDGVFLRETCLKGILEHEDKRSSQWMHKGSSSVFATWLAMIALHEILELHNSGLLTMSSQENHEANAAKTRALNHLLQARGNDGGWGDCPSETAGDAGDVAITALVFYAKSLIVPVQSPQDDRDIQSAIAYLIKREDTIRKQWIYSPPDSDYKLFYLSYLILAFSTILDSLTDDQLEFYYRIVHFLIEDIVKYNERALVGCKETPTSTGNYHVWMMAHVLHGLSSIPMFKRDIVSINRLMARDLSNRKVEARSPIQIYASVVLRFSWNLSGDWRE